MRASRKTRAKVELTFLELVKADISSLREDIMGIKLLIQKIADPAMYVHERDPCLKPPPAPPPLDVYDRNFLISTRIVNDPPTTIQLPTLVDNTTKTEIDWSRLLSRIDALDMSTHNHADSIRDRHEICAFRTAETGEGNSICTGNVASTFTAEPISNPMASELEPYEQSAVVNWDSFIFKLDDGDFGYINPQEETLALGINPEVDSDEILMASSISLEVPFEFGISSSSETSKLVNQVDAIDAHFKHLPSVGTWLALTSPFAQQSPLERTDNHVTNGSSIRADGDWRSLPSCIWERLHAGFRPSGGAAGEDRKDFSSDMGVDSSSAIWSEKETGEYVKALISQYQHGNQNMETFRVLEAGIETVKLHCPMSNRPALDEVINVFRLNILLKERVQRASSSSSGCCPKDQQWEDEDKGLWWYQGRLICYYCGDEGCHLDSTGACERRRREVSGMIDGGGRRRKRRK